MYGYIYETINLINGKKYIGQKKSNIFLKEDYLGSGRFIQLAINKHGKENFKVRLIEECFSKEDLDNKEKYWIEYYNAVKSKDYYNISQGGEHWNLSSEYIAETNRKYQSNKIKGRMFINKDGIEKLIWPNELNQFLAKGWVKGRDRTKIKSFIESSKGTHHTKETKEKISKTQKGKHVSKETKKKISDYLKNYYKIHEHHAKGKHISEETRRKMSESAKRRYKN